MSNLKDKEQRDKSEAVSPSRPLMGSTAVDQHEPLIECADCGVMTTPDRADFAEGDGGIIPDRWFCHRCQKWDAEPADYDDEDYYDDDEDYYDDDDGICERCGGDGVIITCCDDMCVGAGECMHGDGEILCPKCGGDY